jgi:putative ABC transport system ATP-binding protein
MMIQIKNLTKVYNQGTQKELYALSKVSLSIEQGELIAIMGRSGSGKTTLMNILGFLDRPTAGEYWYQGVNRSLISSAKQAKLRANEIGILLQDFGLIEVESSFNNVKMPLYFTRTPMHRMNELAFAAMERVGVLDLRNQKVSTLSGGQKQRVALARALVASPSLILADEPTGALDSTTGEEILSLLCDLNAQGVTIVLVTHDEAVAKRCHRILVLKDGYLLPENGSP